MKFALNPLALALTAGLLFILGANASPALEQQVSQDPATAAPITIPNSSRMRVRWWSEPGRWRAMVVDYLSTAD